MDYNDYPSAHPDYPAPAAPWLPLTDPTGGSRCLDYERNLNATLIATDVVRGITPRPGFVAAFALIDAEVRRVWAAQDAFRAAARAGAA